MSIVQLIVVVYCAVVIINRTLRFVRREPNQSLPKLITIIGIWGMIGAITLYPQIAHWIRKELGLGENFNTEIFIAFVMLFALYFRMLTIIEHLETTITELVRKEALRGLPTHRIKRKRS